MVIFSWNCVCVSWRPYSQRLLLVNEYDDEQQQLRQRRRRKKRELLMLLLRIELAFFSTNSQRNLCVYVCGGCPSFHHYQEVEKTLNRELVVVVVVGLFCFVMWMFLLLFWPTTQPIIFNNFFFDFDFDFVSITHWNFHSIPFFWLWIVHGCCCCWCWQVLCCCFVEK